MNISDEERQARIDLAACYRLHALNGWTDLIYTHISARVPGTRDHFLLNPFGLMFDEVTASNLVKIDSEGQLVAPSPHDIHRAAGNSSRQHDSRQLFAERDQVPGTHRRAHHDDGLTPVGKQIVDGTSLTARRCKSSQDELVSSVLGRCVHCFH